MNERQVKFCFILVSVDTYTVEGFFFFFLDIIMWVFLDERSKNTHGIPAG